MTTATPDEALNPTPKPEVGLGTHRDSRFGPVYGKRYVARLL